MENSDMLIYSSSPHVKGVRTTKNIMINVCIALLPTAIMGVIYFGLYALLLLALSSISAVLSEFIYLLIMKKPFKDILREFDFSSLVTGLLIGLTVGTNYPFYSVILGSAFSVIVVKMLFGGTGKNIVNPAIAGRIFIFISFQSVVGSWVVPSISSLFGGSLVTGATALTSILKTPSEFASLSILDYLLGTGLSGCIGETCKVAILIGAIYLACLKIIDIKLPAIAVAVSGLFTVFLNGFDFNYFLPAILSGGLILGAFFMATDYVTTPNTTLGNYIYFILFGILVAILRQATKMEVVSFAILLMNILVPLIDKFVLHRPFGYVKNKEKK